MTTDPGANFWAEALKLYAIPGAAAALLPLQDDFGGDVMETLWAIVASKFGRTLSPGDIAQYRAATRPARAIAATLRAERRQLKTGPPTPYANAKSAELKAERAIATAAPNPNSAGYSEIPTPLPQDLARRNLAIIFSAFKSPPPNSLCGSLAALAADEM